MANLTNIWANVGLSSRTCNDRALDVSELGDVSIAMEDGVTVVSLTEATCERREQPSYRITRVQCAPDKHLLNVGLEHGMEDDYARHADIMELLLDQNITSKVENSLGSPSISGYKFARWSPAGMDIVGKCVLVTLTVDYRMSLYTTRDKQHTWYEDINLTNMLLDHELAVGFNMCGTVTEPKRQAHRYKHRTDCLRITDLCWYPQLMTEDDEDAAKKQQYGILATATKTSHVIFWKIYAPISKEQVDIEKMVHLDRNAHVTSMTWSQGASFRESVLFLGCANGQVLAIKINDWTITEIWPLIDHIPVHCLCWLSKSNVLVAGKGTYIATFVVSSETATVTSSAVTTMPTKYGITDVVADCEEELYIATADAQILKSTICLDSSNEIALTLQPILLKRNSTKPQRNHGVRLSRNAALLFVLESPGSSYCHLAMKNPLKFNIVVNAKPEVICKRLLDPTNQCFRSSSDLLVVAKYLLSLENDERIDGITKFYKSMSSTEDGISKLQTASPYQLKLYRFLVQLKMNTATDEGKDGDAPSLNGLLHDVETLLLARHIVSCLETLPNDASDQNPENQIVLLKMCQFLKEATIVDDASAESIVEELKATLAEHASAVVEKCLICQHDLVGQGHNKVICDQGHAYCVCVQTLMSCQVFPYRKCHWCGVLATAKITTLEGSERGTWLDGVRSSQCTLCDHTLTY